MRWIDVLRPQLLDQFQDRWKIPDWHLHFPWWGPPASCRILMYGDSSVHLYGGGFQGLTYVAAWWSILWQDVVIELPSTASLRHFGAVGIDALGRRAPRCAVFEWVWPKEPIYKPKIPWYEWVQLLPELDFGNIPIEKYMAGGILHELTHSFGPHSAKRCISDKPPSEKELSHAIAKGTEKGVAALMQDLQRQQVGIGKLVERNFSAKQ